MNMKHKKTLLEALSIITVFFSLISFTMSDSFIIIFIIISLAFLFITTITHIVLWRCPYCKSFLGRVDFGTHCKYCGKELYD